MAPALGKRKRVSRAELERPSRSSSPASDDNDSGAEDLQAIFRRAFEAKFKPLAVEPKKQKVEEPVVQEDDDDDEEESDWSGISEDEADKVEIVEYTGSRRERDETSRAELKAFMSSKPPTSAIAAPSTTNTTGKKKEDDDVNETTNLKHDMALQKLLRESHLLSASSSGTSTPALSTTGIARHKSADLHLQSLGAKSSVFAQKKMPMSQRKHMIQKARTTEEKRRAEAKEAGIVLEVEKKFGRKDVDRKRERGVGGPSIGKFRGGTLSLSKKDVRSLTGGGGAKGKGKGKGKGMKGKR
ncbi:hypothetical protein P153DRAFT_367727 [Dothidotthia symphoricarpi CBS 119687]|uniref:Protein FAF1 n=1 Tax=Dothidotthia symphoricarpi CBS 119687 TaxID=1392245 RepID=A0A6A6AD03_9PLEO|nr:uncharacterized protein P153DRAFT_367727 [Dothidotthia symphoricarpi CBS 119687]KAF2128621.1 hypothetical protein P153DRAFT_367727 [Dothidotthia symphoricarpi CBS 119687]